MSKRFTDTAKWGKEWFQELPPHLKCFWQFLCDNADAAGVWEPNFKLASFQIGKAVVESDLEKFGHRIGRMKCGKVVLISFIEFQYGKLSEACKPHVPIFRLLKKHSLPDSLCDTLSNTLPRRVQEKEEEEDQETETEKDRGDARGGNGETPPADSPKPFDEFWQAYPRRVGKGNAEAAWKKHACDAILPQILVAIRAAKISSDWTKEAGQFIPHPATWLNRRGWEDEHGISGVQFTAETGPESFMDRARAKHRADCYPETELYKNVPVTEYTDEN